MDKYIESIDALMTQFLRVVNLFQEIERQPYDFGVGELLHPSEIHMVDAIGDNAGSNVTTLAHTLGVTKGAVSQMIGKLATRGLVVKRKSPDNDRDVILALTRKGKRAYDAHKLFHRTLYHGFLQQTDGITLEQIESFRSLLSAVERYIETHDHRGA